MDISESLELVYSSSESIGHRFYDQFFADCPEAITYFEDVDMKRQAVVVTSALTLVEQYLVTPFVSTEEYFRYLGDQHQKIGIPTEMYPLWIRSMLKALAQLHGTDWDERLESQWRKGFEAATEKMLESYS